MIGNDDCMACIVSSRYMAGQVQQNMKCIVYKIDSNAKQNQKLLTGLFGSQYAVPKYYIEHENTQLTPWSGNNMNFKQLQHDMQDY
ncbi:MAG: hypothetical protein EOP45_05415 [Sphingobacteriaceae bacterium]|nr:MAG: hypothetical protein EOP45_05415 [Sphingobacteriaceae bacterium]